jgi:naphthalene 1,2-dioxygenase system ferredoxin subunit
MTGADKWTRVAATREVEEGEVIGRGVGGRDLAICRVLGTVYATDNICTHARARLSDGAFIDGYELECPLHGGKFDVRTGKGLCEPINQDLRTYPVRIVGDEVQVFLGGEVGGSN